MLGLPAISVVSCSGAKIDRKKIEINDFVYFNYIIDNI